MTKSKVMQYVTIFFRIKRVNKGLASIIRNYHMLNRLLSENHVGLCMKNENENKSKCK